MTSDESLRSDEQPGYPRASERLLAGMGTATLAAIELTDTATGDVPIIPQVDAHGRYAGPEERALAATFYDSVWAIDLDEVLHLQTDRAKPPRNLGDYKLAPLRTKTYRHSSLPTASWVEQPYGIEFSYRGKKDAPPYLDSSFAIGLCYKDRLSAVAAAHLTPEGALRIVQLQSVSPPVKNPETKPAVSTAQQITLANKYESGLHGGFLWRQTLVQSWIKLAGELGIPTVEIQGWKNNKWREPAAGEDRAEIQRRLWTSHDGVAESMGFVFDPASNNWIL